MKADKMKDMEEIRDALIEMNQCNSDKKDVSKIEENMLSCYALQRRDINSGSQIIMAISVQYSRSSLSLPGITWF